MPLNTPNWFVALPVTAGEWYAKAVENLPPAFRLNPPDDLHLTIAFFGAYRPEYEDAVRQKLRTISWPPMTITLGKLIPLPSPAFYSALSFEVESGKAEAVQIIAQERASLYRLAGAKPDNRPPLPHITLGRPARKASRTEREEILQWAAALKLPHEPILLDSIALYTWADDRSQRQFKIMEKVKMVGGDGL